MTASPNTQLRPVTFIQDPQTHEISVGGVSLNELARTHGTPLYILDNATLREMMRAYKDAFAIYPGPVEVLFAGKANLTMGLCAMVHQEGLGLDVVSGGEFYTGLQAGFPPEKMVFNGNNKSVDELTLALGRGIGKISVDNFYELGLIDQVARSLGKKAQVLLRVTPGIECHTHDYIKTGHIDSKFGFNLSQLPEAVAQIVNRYADTIQLVGLHAHIGSQIFDTRPYYDLADVLLGLFDTIRKEHGLTLTHLNMGGGLGVVYQDQDDPPSVSDYAKVMVDEIVAAAGRLNLPLPTLLLEPGRSLTATAGMTLYTVGSIKTIPEINKTYVSVDGGMGDNIRPALYQAVYSAMVANKANVPHTRTVTIAGKYCESGDILIRELQVPEDIASGDLLLVFGTGAYNYSMASNYNRVPRPAMVLVANGQSHVLVARETLDDVIARDLIPDALGGTPDALAR